MEGTDHSSQLGESNTTDNAAVPLTPEIINSLVAISNPLDKCLISLNNSNNTSDSACGFNNVNNSIDAPCSNIIQNMRSQLIKESLKVTLQKKHAIHHASTADNNNSTSLSSCPAERFCTSNTSCNHPVNNIEDYSYHQSADEEDVDTELGSNIQQKRRERNKIAAIKCRLKKKERTLSLVQESELLEKQNESLRLQMKELEKQRRRLFEMLNVHKPNCIQNLHKKSKNVDNNFHMQKC